ncbi:D-alanyl-D-alanine carboxypeptidase/D-alanyl-D-alanine-endopeptidase [Nonomuraea sp. NPDC049152]|uniref:D-alanyl-D-alanine carboxypeptidase/D-alanyl-D-alanine endopeptidase n=1 Tax=Nonomuraea sp. NPDC049152 TaxID=3154350 RepID=UPI0033D39F4C
MVRRERWVALTTLAMLQAVTIVIGAYAMTNDFSLGALTRPEPLPTERAEPSPVPVVTSGPVLATGGDGPLPTKGTLAARLTDALGDEALGDRVGAVVIDAATGQQIFASNAATGITPASTTKVVTCVAALASLGPDARLKTSVVQGAKRDSIVLVGGGDPTLAGPSAKPGAYPKQASLVQLASRTAAALKASGVTKVTLSYDASLFTGGSSAPGWKPNYIPEGEVAPVHALEIDEGRQNPSSSSPRAADPAASAASAFARTLGKYGIGVGKSIRPAKATPGADALATVESAPVYALVERTLTRSDNDLAEALARHVAIKEGQPASFEGASRAVLSVLKRLGGDKGVVVTDGSGLSIRNRISADALARLLAIATKDEALRPLLSGMPVAGFTGTLGHRFTDAYSKTEVGLVRGKTGTLNNVNTLAGFATTRTGRLVTFAFMADKVPYTAEPILDRLAAIVARS